MTSQDLRDVTSSKPHAMLHLLDMITVTSTLQKGMAKPLTFCHILPWHPKPITIWTFAYCTNRLSLEARSFDLCNISLLSLGFLTVVVALLQHYPLTCIPTSLCLHPFCYLSSFSIPFSSICFLFQTSFFPRCLIPWIFPFTLKLCFWVDMNFHDALHISSYGFCSPRLRVSTKAWSLLLR